MNGESAIRHEEVVEYNILSNEPTHRLMIRKEWHDGVYWANGYTYHGHIWGIINPKVGRIIQTQLEDRYKIVKIGNEWDNFRKKQVKTVYAIPWNDK